MISFIKKHFKNKNKAKKTVKKMFDLEAYIYKKLINERDYNNHFFKET